MSTLLRSWVVITLGPAREPKHYLEMASIGTIRDGIGTIRDQYVELALTS